MFEIIKAVQAREDDVSGYTSGGDKAFIPTDPVGTKFNSVGSIVTELLKYVYVAAGLILLLMLISGGIGLMTSGGNPDKMKAGYGKITSALIGFLIVFVSYMVVQIVERIFGVDIL